MSTLASGENIFCGGTVFGAFQLTKNALIFSLKVEAQAQLCLYIQAGKVPTMLGSWREVPSAYAHSLQGMGFILPSYNGESTSPKLNYLQQHGHLSNTTYVGQ